MQHRAPRLWDLLVHPACQASRVRVILSCLQCGGSLWEMPRPCAPPWCQPVARSTKLQHPACCWGKLAAATAPPQDKVRWLQWWKSLWVSSAGGLRSGLNTMAGSRQPHLCWGRGRPSEIHRSLLTLMIRRHVSGVCSFTGATESSPLIHQLGGSTCITGLGEITGPL